MAISKELLKGVKDEVTALNKEIENLTKQRDALSVLLGSTTPAAAKQKKAKAKSSDTTTASAEAPKAATPAKQSNRKGYMEGLLSFMFGRAEVALAALFGELERLHPGVQQNSLNAAIQNELKKGDKARIARVRPGVYKITDAGVDALNAQEGVGPAQPSNVSEAPAAQVDEGVQEEPQAVGF